MYYCVMLCLGSSKPPSTGAVKSTNKNKSCGKYNCVFILSMLSILSLLLCVCVCVCVPVCVFACVCVYMYLHVCGCI